MVFRNIAFITKYVRDLIMQLVMVIEVIKYGTGNGSLDSLTPDKICVCDNDEICDGNNYILYILGHFAIDN